MIVLELTNRPAVISCQGIYNFGIWRQSYNNIKFLVFGGKKNLPQEARVRCSEAICVVSLKIPPQYSAAFLGDVVQALGGLWCALSAASACKSRRRQSESSLGAGVSSRAGMCWDKTALHTSVSGVSRGLTN